MSVDAYIKLDGIKGESTAKGYEGEIQIETFSWGVNNAGTFSSQSGGGGSGKADLSSFNFMHKSDKSSCELFSHCCQGKHVKEATVTLLKSADGGQKPFLKYKFTDLLIDSVQWSGGTEALPVEAVSLNFAKVEMEYLEQSATGAMTKAASASWNVKTNTK